MTYFRQLLRRLAVWMSGRNGLDQLGIASLLVSVALQMIASVSGAGILMLVSLALYGWSLFRIFSKKSFKRADENRKFLTGWGTLKTRLRQFFTRLKLMRQYKYFKCPQCKALLRLTRGQGEKEVCCPQCQHRFRMKA